VAKTGAREDARVRGGVGLAVRGSLAKGHAVLNRAVRKAGDPEANRGRGVKASFADRARRGRVEEIAATGARLIDGRGGDFPSSVVNRLRLLSK
jgi:hypothetical protein